jgi:hypothetical protein
MNDAATTKPVKRDHGELPPWREADLPEPLPFSLRNTLHTIGPGAILLVGAIGGGEWIVGPMMAVTYGPGILWIATIAILLQSLFNLEAVRYTIYTGEPILSGVMRLKPGPKFWAPFYIAIGAAQLATPAIAAACAIVLFTGFAGRAPGPTDGFWKGGIGMGVVLLGAVLLMSGKSIERLLEKVSWGMIFFIFGFLISVNLFCVPASLWKQNFLGFFTFRKLPEGLDLMLFATFAATAGSGGLGNLAISNWFRDKGFGMGQRVGGISGALSEEKAELPAVGYACDATDENQQRWRGWWRYARIDQQMLWGFGCLMGMFLNVNLATAIVPHGLKIPNDEVGAFQAHRLSEQFWNGLWFLTLFNGFWILFSTHLGNTDCLVRTATDMLWAGSTRIRRHTVSRIYAALLAGLTVWALFAIHLGKVLDLFKVLGVLASPIMAIASLQILRVNTRFLPPEFRPALWRRIALVLCAIVYGGISIAVLGNLLGIKVS